MQSVYYVYLLMLIVFFHYLQHQVYLSMISHVLYPAMHYQHHQSIVIIHTHTIMKDSANILSNRCHILLYSTESLSIESDCLLHEL
jgi:hypothetical protein